MRRIMMAVMVLTAGAALSACEMMQQPMFQATPAMRESPTAWCVYSPEPARCRARAAVEHEICRGANNYGACRHAVDQMHGQ